MDQYQNNRQNEVLWNLLADPANNGHAYVANLQSLVAEFPQSGVLHTLFAHAEGGQSAGNAAAYINPMALYKLIHSPESLAVVNEGQIVQQTGGATHMTPEAGVQPENKVVATSVELGTEPIIEEPADFTHYHDAEASEEVEQKESQPAAKMEAIAEEPADFTHNHYEEASEELAHIVHAAVRESDHEKTDLKKQH